MRDKARVSAKACVVIRYGGERGWAKGCRSWQMPNESAGGVLVEGAETVSSAAGNPPRRSKSWKREAVGLGAKVEVEVRIVISQP